MIPRYRKLSYIKLHSRIRPGKVETYRFRACVGGYQLEYPEPTSTETSSVTNIKLHINSNISTPGAQFLGAGIKDFYYDTPMEIFEYANMKLEILPDEIVTQ